MSIEDLSDTLEQHDGDDTLLETRDIIRDAVERQRAEAEPRPPAPISEASEKKPGQAERGGRDGKGRFAVQERTAPTVPVVEAPAPDATETAARDPGPASEAEPTIGAPQTYSAQAKLAFAHAPPVLREAIARREAEIDAGLSRYAGMDPYLRLAEERGTSLTGALAQYTQIEDVLRRDPVEGIQRIAANMNMNPVSLAQAILNRFQSGAPASTPQTAHAPARQTIDEQTVATRVLEAIEARNADADRLRDATAFAADPQNRFYKDVRATMAGLIHMGAASTLKEAYDKACWAHPEVRAQMMKGEPGSIQQRAAAAIQAKGAARAVVGAPGPGTRPVPTSPHETTLDTVRRAVQNARGAL